MLKDWIIGLDYDEQKVALRRLDKAFAVLSDKRLKKYYDKINQKKAVRAELNSTQLNSFTAFITR